MENFHNFIQKQFRIALVFFALGLFFGLIYSINLLGVSIPSETLLPSTARSLHISLMLYGFIPLMLSFLPFLLINKEVGYSPKGLYFLHFYVLFWYIFLIFMVVSLLFGNSRDLPFYDFVYELNFILALAGFFYIRALIEFMKGYKTYPLWIKVSLLCVVIAPFMLLILMNPVIGQVESTVTGPHGDNTLGMSFALIPIYYLIFKLLSQNAFKARWHICWIVPFGFYILSVLHRSFYGPLSYNQEWFLQYLSLLYVPLLYRWYQDALIQATHKKALLISIVAFLFVDIQGNILFIPEIRWLIHRNDLVIAHAHVAMGIGIFFMAVAMFVNYFKVLQTSAFYVLYCIGMLGIFSVLSLSGLVQAGFSNLSIDTLWLLRSLFGVVVILSLLFFVRIKLELNTLQMYNLAGVLSDGLGGVFLILLASFIYPLLGFTFHHQYEYVVFAFVSMTGVIHFMALQNPHHARILTKLTVIIRIMVSSIFVALYFSNSLGLEAVLIATCDMAFVLVYLMLFYKKELLCAH